MRVQPVIAYQSTQYDTRLASLAIDRKMGTNSHTKCQNDEIVWFEMEFRTEVCFKEVKIYPSHLGGNVMRMDKTEIYVENKIKSPKTRCGQMDITDTNKALYIIHCDNFCGSVIRLEVYHKTDDYYYQACIHMFEIEAYTGSECPAGYFLKDNVCEPCSEGEFGAGGKEAKCKKCPEGLTSLPAAARLSNCKYAILMYCLYI